jgi:sugar phosphate isomerase/epimerase
VLALSLPSSYLSGTTNDDDACTWHALLGPPAVALGELVGLGVDAIEIGDVRGHVDAATVRTALDVIHGAGLRSHAHLWLPRDFDASQPPPPLVAAVDGIVDARTAAGEGRPTACAVHGHHRDEPDAAAASVRTLGALDGWLRERGARAALEICRFRPQGPIGGTYAETFELACRAGADVGITWDLGHTTWNHLQGHDVLWPDERFLRRVCHVHVHAVGASGRTHFALGEGRAQVDGCVERLRSVGYDGLWDLELYPVRWEGSSSDRRRQLETSIQRLSEVLG